MRRLTRLDWRGSGPDNPIMPNEQLRNAVEALRAGLQQQLDVQLSSLTEHHEQAIDTARRSAEADADVRWTAKLDAVKTEWATRLESELSAARAEADLRFTTEVVRLKAAAEQAAVEAAARTRAQVERAAAEAAARARAEAEQASAELAAKIRAEAEQASAQQEARMRAEAEQASAELAAKIRAEAEQASAQQEARMRAEAEQASAELAAKIRAEAEQASAQQAARMRAEAAQASAEQAAKIRGEAEQASAQQAARMRAEAEQATAQAIAQATGQATARLRAEAEQAAALAAVRVREEADQEVEAERQRGIALLDAERERSAADLNAERQRVGSLLDAERQRLESELVAERQRAEADRVLERQRFDAERQQFRSERNRMEAERQTLLLERDWLQSDAQERAPVLLDQRPGQLDELNQTVQRLESALETERQQSRRFKEELGEARVSLRQVEATLEEERQARASEIAAPVLSVVPEPEPVNLIDVNALESQSEVGMVDRLFGAMRAMDAAKSLTEILTILVQAAATEASRAAVFIGHGDHLQGHKAIGFTTEVGAHRVAATGAGLLAQAVERREAVMSSREPGLEAPAFAGQPGGQASLALPIAIGGEPVAVLYADDGGSTNQVAPASWPEAVQILGSHAASCLAHLTATRTAQAMRIAGSGISGDEGSAKRYARLLVSEIKLYNEAAVRVGRENRDLLNRLRSEIDRARRLYEERVPAGTGPQHAYFQQELVQTLADGDAALLGQPA